MITSRKFLNESSNFSLVVLITILVTRISALSFFYFGGSESQITQSIVNDPFHHYQLGLTLIVLSILFKKYRKSILLAAIGLGIFLEEWAVFLKDLGLNTNHLYLTKIDFFSIISVVGLIYILSKALFIKTRHQTN